MTASQTPARTILLAACLGIALFPATAVPGSETANRSVGLYVGQVTYTRFNEVIRGDTDFRDSYVAALTAAHVLHAHDDYARWEAEGQVARHWGKQDHFELNAALLLRWERFPWRSRFHTTVALGVGPSFASSVPAIERKRHDHASRRLAFMPFEITAGPAGDAPWETFARVHHRSGVFDLVSRGGGSNFVAIGVRRSFK